MLISEDVENSVAFFNRYGELIMQTPFIIADELHSVVITGWDWVKFIISVVSADYEY